MTDSGGDSPEDIFVLRVPWVRQAIDRLLGRDVHAFFPAYLHLRRESRSQGTTTEIEPNWARLGDDLRMAGGPPNKVHLRPFWSGARNNYQEWLGENLAGSYSPSSLRQAAFSVIDVDASGRYALREDHWNQALTHLLGNQRLSGYAIAAFMLRDRAWKSASTPEAAVLIDSFRSEFGYDDQSDDEFETLYELEWGADAPWFVSLAHEDEAAD